MSRIELIQRAVLIAAVLFSFFVGLGGVPLFDKDEGAFCEATREMVTSGNYLMTYLNGAPRYDKPILIYWLQAASVKVFGLTEFALRLPSAIAAALWAWATFWFVRRVLDSNKAFFATFFLVTALQVTIIGKAAIADSVLNLFIALTMFNLYLFYQFGLKRQLYFAMAAMALGFLDKGPVAILIPMGTCFLFCLFERNLRGWPKMFFNPVGLLIFFAIAAPWYIAAIADQGMPIVNAWVFKQTLGRFHKPLEGHAGGYLYYFPVVLGGTMPYTALLAIVVWNIRRDLKSPLNRFLLLWFIFTFVFFSFSGTKLPHYVIYGYTGLFILMAIHLEQLRSDLWLLVPVLAFLIILIVLPFCVPLALPYVKSEFAQSIIKEALPGFGMAYQIPLVAALAVCLVLAVVGRIPRAVRLVVLGFVIAGLINLHFMPIAAGITQEPIHQAALIAKEKNLDVYMWKLNMPSFIFYRQKILPKGIPQPGDYVLSKMQLMNMGEFEVIYQKNGIGLVRVKSLAGVLSPTFLNNVP